MCESGAFPRGRRAPRIVEHTVSCYTLSHVISASLSRRIADKHLARSAGPPSLKEAFECRVREGGSATLLCTLILFFSFVLLGLPCVLRHRHVFVRLFIYESSKCQSRQQFFLSPIVGGVWKFYFFFIPDRSHNFAIRTFAALCEWPRRRWPQAISLWRYDYVYRVYVKINNRNRQPSGGSRTGMSDSSREPEYRTSSRATLGGKSTISGEGNLDRYYMYCFAAHSLQYSVCTRITFWDSILLFLRMTENGRYFRSAPRHS